MEHEHQETHTCEDCLNEFSINHNSKDAIEHCPFCGAYINMGEEIEDDYDVEDEWGEV
tara:strand:- start:319 stop:492 length:174 start_codon:yes stop_codon:yes gene_type:complete